MSKLSTLRGLIRELRYVLPDASLKNNLAFQYIMKQYRKYNTTDQQLCKARDEMNFIANTYLCYLRSSRLSQEIHEEFHGKGERTVQETARMVGFKLPHDPKEEMNFIANTYLCYLRSSRLSQEIHEEFHGKGERTVQETARMVGFKLPHDPK